jgi:hypothetical protein
MTDFSAETFQNQYLAVGGTEVNAVVRVTASGADASAAGSGPAAEVIILDVSGSMNYPRSKIREAREATMAAVGCIRDGVLFAIVAGTDVAREVYPGRGALAVASDTTRAAARKAVNDLKSGGGTAIGQWLRCADTLFAAAPPSIKHAILLTDGQNQDETPEQLDASLDVCDGHFQCDCRGVGADWEVSELREIADRLIGDVDVIREPEHMAADFTAMMERSMGRAVNDVALRVWTPQGASIGFVKQVAPEIVDLTDRRIDVDGQRGDYPTGAWGDESRDYHVCIRVPARDLGEQMLAGRVSLVVDDETISETKVLAEWTEDENLSTAIVREVAFYTGKQEIQSHMQKGVAALRDDDPDTATRNLGLAAKIADAIDDQAVIDDIANLVDIEDAATGKVRPKSRVDDADLMQAEVASSKTVRTKKPAS